VRAAEKLVFAGDMGFDERQRNQACAAVVDGKDP
jgi:hypothetical protein